VFRRIGLISRDCENTYLNFDPAEGAPLNDVIGHSITYRVAVDGHVQLDYKDYRDGAKHKSLTLSGAELIRRFLLHVLPRGFMRVRHFGFLANRCRAQRLSAIRVAIEEQTRMPSATVAEVPEGPPFDGYPCPKCRKGRLRIVDELVPQRQRLDGG
jgi:hypothetical protein